MARAASDRLVERLAAYFCRHISAFWRNLLPAHFVHIFSHTNGGSKLFKIWVCVFHVTYFYIWEECGIHRYTVVFIYIYIYVCVCVCVYIKFFRHSTLPFGS